MTDTAANQLRRILRVIPEIGDGHEHGISEIAALTGVTPELLVSDLRVLADRCGNSVTVRRIWCEE